MNIVTATAVSIHCQLGFHSILCFDVHILLHTTVELTPLNGHPWIKATSNGQEPRSQMNILCTKQPLTPV